MIVNIMSAIGPQCVWLLNSITAMSIRLHLCESWPESKGRWLSDTSTEAGFKEPYCKVLLNKDRFELKNSTLRKFPEKK